MENTNEVKSLKTSFDLIFRYNSLLEDINSSLDDLQKGIAGLVVMSTELEEIFNCIYEGRVPSSWLKGIKEYYNSILIIIYLARNNFRILGYKEITFN